MVIKCEDEGKLLAVLAKLETESNITWVDGKTPTENDITPCSYPVWISLGKYLKYTEDHADIMGEIEVSDYSFLHNFFCDTQSSHDPVNHPSHYTQGKVECIDAMEQVLGTEVVKGFCAGNTFKYLWRYRDKNGQEDIDKAVWYFNRLKQILNR